MFAEPYVLEGHEVSLDGFDWFRVRLQALVGTITNHRVDSATG